MVVDGSYYAAFIESAFGKLNKADAAIYSIDARGLSMTPPSDSLFEFADRTGGEIFYNRNDLDECMRVALEDMAVVTAWDFICPKTPSPGDMNSRSEWTALGSSCDIANPTILPRQPTRAPWPPNS